MKKARIIIIFVLILAITFSGRAIGASAENKTGIGSIWILFEENIGNFWKKITQTFFAPKNEQNSKQDALNNGRDDQVDEVEKIDLAIPLAETPPFKRAPKPPAPSSALAPKKTPCPFFETPLTCLFPKETETRKEDSRLANKNTTQNTAPNKNSLTNNAPTTASSSTYPSPPPAKTPATTSTQIVSAPPKQNPPKIDADALINSVFDGLGDEEDIINPEDDSDIFNDDGDLDEIGNIFDESDFQ